MTNIALTEASLNHLGLYFDFRAVVDEATLVEAISRGCDEMTIREEKCRDMARYIDELEKRTYDDRKIIATAALQGLGWQFPPNEAAEKAIEYADALLKALEPTP